ncbi:MAG: acyl-CoA synthetase [Elusimicrobia bacterium]|nr:acyl-CoA synthetase [Elusimicrobiota bacterium]
MPGFPEAGDVPDFPEAAADAPRAGIARMTQRLRFSRLSDLLTQERPPDGLVAFDHDRPVDWRGFRGAVADMCIRLGGERNGRWLLACGSSYSFAVGLCALWQTDNVAVLPPNLRPGSIAECLGTLEGGIGDIAPRATGQRWLKPAAGGTGSFHWRRLDPSRKCVELFTSGSTGESKRVVKAVAQLEEEVAVLERTFGERLGACSVFATVSHQHIYGMLFRLLWPLCAGRPFHAQTFFFWEEIFAAMRRQAAGCIISSPVHLDRIDQASDVPPGGLGCRAIFSSGCLLKLSSSEAVLARTGCAPIEVFGSTETGGVGWRRQCGEGAGADWRPLEGVSVSIAGAGAGPDQLQVRSPFAEAGKDSPAQMMGDRGAVLEDGRFRVFGRVDRIAKIAEERFSLDEMERRLQAHPWVAHARLVILQGAGRPARDFVGAVVVLKASAQRQLLKPGRPELPNGASNFPNGLGSISRTLREHLRRHFEPVTLPRHFRYVDAFPMDAQGKTTAPALKRLFHPPYDPAVTQPERLERVRTSDKITLRLRVPPDLGYLDGHFPEFPVVPGVVQTKWAWMAASELLGRVPALKEMEAVKFRELLLPGREFSLRVVVKRTGGEEKLFYEFADGDVLFSSGRFILGEPSPQAAAGGA